MMCPKVAGLTPQRVRRESQAFCNDLIRLASKRTRFSVTVAIGSTTCTISLPDSSYAATSPLSAFVAQPDSYRGQRADSSVSIISREDLPAIPSLEWARYWIERHEVVPETVTYPFKVFVDKNTGLIYVYDTRTRTGLVRTRHQDETDLRGMITPFRLMWAWIATSSGAVVVHASAVRTKNGTAVFAGASGTGKSTTALSIALAGNQLISDDCLWVQDGHCYTIFDRAKLKSESAIARTLTRRGVAISKYPTEGNSKSFFNISQLNNVTIRSAPITHIFFPKIWPVPSSLRLDSRASYRLLERDSGREVFGNGARSRIRIAALCDTVPASVLWLSPDFEDNMALIASLLQKSHNV